jgi:TatD DNase family protein
MNELVDIGVNLTHAQFRNDLPAVLERAAAAGVRRLVVTGTSVGNSRAALALAAQHPDRLWATAGIHPHDARHADAAALAALAELLAHPRCVAAGECGLDFDRDFSPRPQQEAAFVAQLELAAATGKPLFLHERAAHERFLALLAPRRASLGAAVVHCFTGSAAELDAYLALDLHIGITGWICDERRGLGLRELVGRVPLERLMLETDAPFLTPRALVKRHRRNEPAFLVHVLDTVATVTGRTREELAAATTATATRFFGITTAAC